MSIGAPPLEEISFSCEQSSPAPYTTRVLSGETAGLQIPASELSVALSSESVATRTSSCPLLSGPTSTMKLPSGENAGSSADSSVGMSSSEPDVASATV